MKKSKKPRVVLLRRKSEGKTNYKKRLMRLKSRKTRLVVRRSLKYITAQLVDYSPSGDKIITSVNSKELDKYGFKFSKGNIVAAYLTGLLVGKKAKKKGITDAIVDLGLYQSTKGSKLYAAVKGAIDAGMNIPCSHEILPTDERIKGQHIKTYAEKIKKDEKYKKQFSHYIKESINPEAIAAAFEDAKAKILKE